MIHPFEASPASLERFRGLFAAPHTPFGVDGRFRGATVASQYELLSEAGAAGVFLCGTAGEGLSLTLAERRAVLESWVGVTEGGIGIIAHVGHDSIRDAVELARHAAGSGANAIAAMAPTYYRPATLEQLVEFLAPIAAAAPELPFLYYDAPDFNGVRFATDRLLHWGRLRIPNLCGVKFTSGDLATLARCARLGDDWAVMLGYEHLLLPALALGIRGAIGVTFSFATPLYREIIRAFEAGEMEVAQEASERAGELALALQEFGVVRATKAIMGLVGVDCGRPRLPLGPVEGAELRALVERLQPVLPFVRPLAELSSA